MKNFFISYNHNDERWAEWIAGTLEDAGYATVIQAWDFPPGSNFAVEMHKAAAECERTIAVLSKVYLASLFTLAEWLAAFVDDPSGAYRKVVPVRVEQCDVTGLLKPIVHCDLVGLDAQTAKERLLKAVRAGRHKPEQIVFPGHATENYPGPSSTSRPENESEEVHAIKRLLDVLKTSYTTFVAQCRVRNELVDTMYRRLDIKERREYERFFSLYYEQMNDEERHMHSIIRVYTANVLSQYNTHALQILEDHPELVEKIKLLPELRQHLTLWLAKYKGILERYPHVCLVYVGVEERVPFPRGVELELQSYLNTFMMKTARSHKELGTKSKKKPSKKPQKHRRQGAARTRVVD